MMYKKSERLVSKTLHSMIFKHQKHLVSLQHLKITKFYISSEVDFTDQGAYTCEAINSIDAILATPDAVLIVDERPLSPTIGKI